MKKLLLIIILVLTITIVGFCTITVEDLATMDYAYQGHPFINVTAKSTIDLTTMDYAFQGQPFVSFIGAGEEPPVAGTNVLFMFTDF